VLHQLALDFVPEYNQPEDAEIITEYTANEEPVPEVEDAPGQIETPGDPGRRGTGVDVTANARDEDGEIDVDDLEVGTGEIDE
jgi:hypothetical protein